MPALPSDDTVPCEGVKPPEGHVDRRVESLLQTLTMRKGRLFSATCLGQAAGRQRVRRCASCQQVVSAMLYLRDVGAHSGSSGSEDEKIKNGERYFAPLSRKRALTDTSEEEFVPARKTKTKTKSGAKTKAKAKKTLLSPTTFPATGLSEIAQSMARAQSEKPRVTSSTVVSSEAAEQRFLAISERVRRAVATNDAAEQYLCTQRLLSDRDVPQSLACASIPVSLRDGKAARWSLCWGFSHRDAEGLLALPEFEDVAPLTAEEEEQQSTVRAAEDGKDAQQRLLSAKRPVPVFTQYDLMRVFGSAESDAMESAKHFVKPELQPQPLRLRAAPRADDLAIVMDPELQGLFPEDDELGRAAQENDLDTLSALFRSPVPMMVEVKREGEQPFSPVGRGFGPATQGSSSFSRIAVDRVRQFFAVKRHPACSRFAVSVDCRKWWDRNICFHCRTTLNKRKVKSFADRAVLSGKVNYSLLCFDELVVQHDALLEHILHLKQTLGCEDGSDDEY